MNSINYLLAIALVVLYSSDVQAGQGGYIVLINRTPYDWKKVYQHSYQMHHFGFPDVVRAGTDAKVYVEFDEGIFKHWGDDAGEVDYRLEGSSGGYKFRIGCTHRHFYAQYNDFSNAGNHRHELGWRHNDHLYWFIGGAENHFEAKQVF